MLFHRRFRAVSPLAADREQMDDGLCVFTFEEAPKKEWSDLVLDEKPVPVLVSRCRRQRFLGDLNCPLRSPVPVRSKFISDTVPAVVSPEKKPGTLAVKRHTPTTDSLLSLLHNPDSLDGLIFGADSRACSMKARSTDYEGSSSSQAGYFVSPLACRSSEAIKRACVTPWNRGESGVLPPLSPRHRPQLKQLKQLQHQQEEQQQEARWLHQANSSSNNNNIINASIKPRRRLREGGVGDSHTVTAVSRAGGAIKLAPVLAPLTLVCPGSSDSHRYGHVYSYGEARIPHPVTPCRYRYVQESPRGVVLLSTALVNSYLQSSRPVE